MKLVELLHNQRVIVQLLWGEQKIEFYSEVIEKDEASIYVTPYSHNGKPLELNVTTDKSVICNLFADSPVTNKRISWKGIELTTVNRNNKTLYCLKTRGYNAIAKIDDRRLHERIEVTVDGRLVDGENGDIGITMRDISDIGVSFYAPAAFVPKSQQMRITFTDNVGEAVYNIKLDCTLSRVSKENNRNLIGCTVLGDNKEYQIYGLLKRLRNKAVLSKSTDKVSGDNSVQEQEGESVNTAENTSNDTATE